MWTSSGRTAVEDLPGAGLEAEPDQPAKTRELVIVNWSGDLDKVWPVLFLSSAAAAASGVRTQVFVTFWGLLPFVKDQKRIIGEHWMQKMLSLMQRPGIDQTACTRASTAAGRARLPSLTASRPSPRSSHGSTRARCTADRVGAAQPRIRASR